MKIKWGNHINIDKMYPGNGFGYATERIITSLRELGYEVAGNLPGADVEIWFDQPEHIIWQNPDAFKIAYIPWESTELKPGWLEKLNSADEVWTPSPVIAEWLVAAGVERPVETFLHGVDDVWSYKPRSSAPSPFTIFHHGGEAARKGWPEVARMHNEVFAGKDSLAVFKMNDMQGFKIPMPGTQILTDRMPLAELVELYQHMSLMVYPSWGEGFGLTPLQAMATGMPVIITKGWAPYEHMLPPECLIDSSLVDSPWPKHHPGQMLKPDYDDMCHKTLEVYENYESYLNKFAEIAPLVRQEFDWITLTDAAFKRLK